MTEESASPEPAKSLTVGDQVPASERETWALIVGILWALIAVPAGLFFAFGVHAGSYGGDAYTGIEGAIVSAVKAIGFLVIASGVIAVLLGARKHYR